MNMNDRELERNKSLNQAAILLYWLCASDPAILEEISSSTRSARNWLRSQGIQDEMVGDEVIATVREHKLVFLLFYEYVVKDCPRPPCIPSSLDDLRSEMVRLLFPRSAI